MKKRHQSFFTNNNWLKTGLFGLVVATLSSQAFADTLYRVKSGDTLNSIANQYNVSVQQLIEINNLTSPNEIKVGDMITVSDSSAKNYKGQKGYYQVQPGDGFTSIAKKFNTSVSVIAEINDFQKDKVLFVGEKILVPMPSSVTTTTQASNQGGFFSKLIQKPTAKVTTVKTSGITTPKTSEATTTPETFIYTVKPSDTLIGVADKFDLYTADLAKLNNLETTARLSVGQKLLIPGSVDRLKALAEEKSGTETKAQTTQAKVATNKSVSMASTTLPKVTIISYTVQSGDSLTVLARRYNTNSADLAKINQINATDQLRIGQKILVPVQGSSALSAKNTTEKY